MVFIFYVLINSQINFANFNWTKIPANVSDVCIGIMVATPRNILLFGGIVSDPAGKVMAIWQFDPYHLIWYCVCGHY